MATLIITRPLQQSQALQVELEQRHFKTLSFPLISVTPLASKMPIDSADKVIAISPNAVRFAEKLLLNLPRQKAEKLLATPLLAIGESSALTARSHGWKHVDYSTFANSEALLTHPALNNVAGQRIMLLCGEGGRDTIQTALQAKGASVVRWEVYQRHPKLLTEQQRAILAKSEQPVYWIVSSQVAIDALVDSTDQKLIVTSERLANYAQTLGFSVALTLSSAESKSIAKQLEHLKNKL